MTSPSSARLTRLRALSLLVAGSIVLTLLVGVGAAAPGSKGGGGGGKGDRTPPTIQIAAAQVGTTLVSLSGIASDNVGVMSVAVSVDGGAYAAAQGTTSWSYVIPTSTLAAGSHTATARASDAAGNSAAASTTFTVAAAADTTPPTATISAPTANTTVSGTLAVDGTASDNKQVAKVELKVDGGAYQTASGTASWSASVGTSALANGPHTLTARATDTSGNVATTSETVAVLNDVTPPTVAFGAPTTGSTVSGTLAVSGTALDNAAVANVELSVDGGAYQAATGTTSWSYSLDTAALADGPHTLSVRATDTSGNVASASVAVSVSNGASWSPAPDAQGSWVSPEGVKITVNSAGPWTIAQVYTILKANALDLATIGPHLTINVQDQYTSQTQASAASYLGKYTNYTATMWLQGVNSGFASRPDDTLAHEYGHAWSLYFYYLVHQGDWSSYENARWTTSDGSLTLATDSRTNSTYSWQVTEIIADDYRLLFGSALAESERPTHLNNQIPDPRNVTGLKDFLLGWRAS